MHHYATPRDDRRACDKRAMNVPWNRPAHCFCPKQPTGTISTVAPTTVEPVAGSCPGSLVLHRVDQARAGCTMDDEREGCAGIDLRHEGEPSCLCD